MVLKAFSVSYGKASASVAREIRTGTALAVLAKPVGRAQFLLAKYVGLAAALTYAAAYTTTLVLSLTDYFSGPSAGAAQ